MGASGEIVSAPEAAAILAPEAAGAPAAQAPFVMPEPRQEPDPLPAATAETEEAEALKPALKPVPREQVRAQAERERAAERPARRPLTDAELLGGSGCSSDGRGGRRAFRDRQRTADRHV